MPWGRLAHPKLHKHRPKKAPERCPALLFCQVIAVALIRQEIVQFTVEGQGVNIGPERRKTKRLNWGPNPQMLYIASKKALHKRLVPQPKQQLFAHKGLKVVPGRHPLTP